MYICVGTYICVQVHMHMCKHGCWGWKLISSIFLHYVHLIFLKQDFSLNLELTLLARMSVLKVSAILLFSCNYEALLAFIPMLGIKTWSLIFCTPSILPAKPSPQLPQTSFLYSRMLRCIWLCPLRLLLAIKASHILLFDDLDSFEECWSVFGEHPSIGVCEICFSQLD